MTPDEHIAVAYDFSSAQTIIALGTKSVRLFATILRNNPHLMGVLFDQATALQTARAILVETGIEQLCDVIAGDFFADVPLWGDLYVLVGLLSQWSDEPCVTVLRHCTQFMHPAGHVLVVEPILSPEQERFVAPSTDGQMQPPQPERARSEQEYRQLFQAAGLHLTRVLPTGTLSSIVEAVVQRPKEEPTPLL